MNNFNERTTETTWINNQKMKTSIFILMALVLIRSIVFEIVDSIQPFADYMWNEVFGNLSIMIACFFLAKPLFSKDNKDYSKRFAAGLGLMLSSVSADFFGIYFFAEKTNPQYFGTLDAIWQMAYVSILIQLLIVVYLLFVFLKSENKLINFGVCLSFFILLHMANAYCFEISDISAYSNILVFIIMMFFLFAKKQRILLVGISLALVLVSIIGNIITYDSLFSESITIKTYIICFYIFMIYLIILIVKRVVLNFKEKGRFSFAPIDNKPLERSKQPLSKKEMMIKGN